MKIEDFEGATIHFHNDADGCSSAAQVCKKLKNFKLVSHNNPNVKQIGEGKHLFLDLGGLKAELVREKDVTVIDHHQTEKLPCRHINPRFVGENYPNSYAVWKLFGDDETAWIAAVGIIGDKGVSKARPLFELIRRKYPRLVPKRIEQSRVYHSKLGKITQLVDSCSSALGEKGGLLNVEVLRTMEPEEILAGIKKAKKMFEAKEMLEKEIERVLKKSPEIEGNLVFLQFESDWSIKSAVANDLLDKNPNKIIVIAQKKGEVFKVSLRGRGKNLAELAKKTTKGIGNGGGHPEAAGLSVSADHWEEFLKRLREEIN